MVAVTGWPSLSHEEVFIILFLSFAVLSLTSDWHVFPTKNDAQAMQLVAAFVRACRDKALLTHDGS